MPLTTTQLIYVLGLSLLSQLACATTAQEAQELALALKQLTAVQTILDRAERQGRLSATEPETRYLFDYEALRGDLKRVQGGIEHYLTPSRAQPRDASQLNGHYLTDRSQQ